MLWESGLVFPSPSSVAAPARGAAHGGSEYSCFSREAISLVCEAVPGAKGATRRRKVYVVVGAGYWRQGEGTSGHSGWDRCFLRLGKLRF